MPRFSPEAFAYIRNQGTGKIKQFREGLDQLLQEGVIQAFGSLDAGRATTLLGAVGQLQFDVVLHRLQVEYNADPRLEPAPFTLVRWFGAGTDRRKVEDLVLAVGVKLAQDLRGKLVILFPKPWDLDYFGKQHPEYELHPVSPHEEK